MQSGFRAADFFLIRCASWSLDEFGVTGRGTSGAESLPTQKDESDALRLERLVCDPLFQDGLSVATPGLARQIGRAGGVTAAIGIPRLRDALLKYALRATRRGTPFGIFAGVALGTIAAAPTDITLMSRDRHRGHIRPDSSVLLRWAASVASKRRRDLTFGLNRSAFGVGDGLQYYSAGNGLYSGAEGLEWIRCDGPVAAVVEALASGPLSHGKLVDLLRLACPGTELEECQLFIDDMVEAQVLLPVLVPSPVGEELGQGLWRELSGLPEFEAEADAIHSILRICNGAIELLTLA